MVPSGAKHAKASYVCLISFFFFLIRVIGILWVWHEDLCKKQWGTRGERVSAPTETGGLNQDGVGLSWEDLPALKVRFLCSRRPQMSFITKFITVGRLIFWMLALSVMKEKNTVSFHAEMCTGVTSPGRSRWDRRAWGPSTDLSAYLIWLRTGTAATRQLW